MGTRELESQAETTEHRPCFDEVLAAQACGRLLRATVTTLQINVGTVCNQACTHCHVEAGPNKSASMSSSVAERIMRVLSASPKVRTVEITGGAPELNRNFTYIVSTSRSLGRRVVDRSNLTVFFEPGMESIPTFIAEHQVEIVASLPCYTRENVDAQRGQGTFSKCIEALKQLNRLGYGMPGSPLRLSLVYNPAGEFLPPSQAALETDYKKNLRELFGIEFHTLLTITNMPIGRFGGELRLRGKIDHYQDLLASHFNRCTVSNVMCRSLVSVGPDGQLFDCDFNQALGIPISGRSRPVWDFRSFNDFDGTEIATDRHCFGCTAGSGSSCGGSLARSHDGEGQRESQP